MALEDILGAGKYIDDLDSANPVGSTDTVSTLDSHIQGIKNVLKLSFPSITGPVTTTQAELNILDGATVTTTELNLLSGLTATAAELNVLDGISGVSTAEVNYLANVTSDIQTQLDSAILVPAEEASHVRANSTQIIDGGGTYSGFSISGNVTAGAWESVGPTGSGATNIWDDLDDLAAEATVVICNLLLQTLTTSDSPANISVYASSLASPGAVNGTKYVGTMLVDPDAANEQYTQLGQIEIPLRTGQIFQIHWTESNSTSTVILYYKGFRVD